MLDRFFILTNEAAYQVDLQQRVATVVARDPYCEATLPEIKGEAASKIAICNSFSFFDPVAGERFLESGHISALFLDGRKAIGVCREYPKRNWDSLWELETRQVIDQLKGDARCVLCSSGIPAEYLTGVDGMVKQALTHQG